MPLFRGWDSALRAALAAAFVYVLIVAALRVVGAQALAKMSGYDLIVTVALGSLVATLPVTKDLALADGVAVLLTFLALQEATRRLQARSLRVHHLVRERPHLVLWDGELLEDRMREVAVSADEVRAAVRRAGAYALADVQAVVLENDGEWSVMPRAAAREVTALDGLDVPERLPSGAPGDAWRTRPPRPAPHPPPPSASGPP